MQRIALILLAVACGAWQASLQFGQMNGDGVSYLEIGEAALRGEWRELFNPCWSPFYGVLAAMAEVAGARMGLPRFGAVTLLNLLLYVLNLLIFLGVLERLRRAAGWRAGESLPGGLLTALGAGLFCAVSLLANSIGLVTPDWAVTLVLLAVLSLSLDIYSLGFDWRRSLLAGALLGAGYWIKAIVFPLALVWMGLMLAFPPAGSRRNLLKPLGAAAVVWLLIAAPLWAGISFRLGRPAFSDAGRLNYLWHVNGVPNKPIRPLPAVYGQPAHAPALLLERPPVFAFAGVAPGVTYPLWYDPSRWYEGLQAKLDAGQIAASIRRNLGSQRRMWLSRYMALFTLLTAAGWRLVWRTSPGAWMSFLVLFCLAPFAMLIPIHTEPRYVIAQVLALAGAGTLATLAWAGRRWPGAAPVLCALLSAYGYGVGFVKANDPPREVAPWRAAAEFAAMGLAPGAGVCVISDGQAGDAAPLKAARLRAVAQVPLEEHQAALLADPSAAQAVEQACARAGGRALMVYPRDRGLAPSGWQAAAAGAYHVRLLQE